MVLYNPRQIVRGNRKRMNPVFQKLYSYGGQLVYTRFQRKAGEGVRKQKDGEVRVPWT